MRRRCPVCRRPADPTTRGNIVAHRDRTLTATCPASGEPFHITEPAYDRSAR